MNVHELEPHIIDFLNRQTEYTDLAHDQLHLRRVLKNAKTIQRAEGGNSDVIFLAGWLHDCVLLPKNHPESKSSSQIAAKKASEFLLSLHLEESFISNVAHCIEAHSFSANIKPTTVEAKIIQDADRLDAIGAIGLMRCVAVGNNMNLPFYDAVDPFAKTRALNDKAFTLDHFYQKLLLLADSFQTKTGREMALERTEFLRAFLAQLSKEIE